jgi:hypothetical protein
MVFNGCPALGMSTVQRSERIALKLYVAIRAHGRLHPLINLGRRFASLWLSANDTVWFKVSGNRNIALWHNRHEDGAA